MAQQLTRGQQAASELAAHCLVYRPEEVVDRLQSGLSQVRDLLLARLHLDVERQFGVDSMIAPISLSHELSQMQNAGTTIDVTGTTVVGRGDDCDLTLDDDKASRRHARLTATADGTITIEDLGSTNGTYVGAVRITEPTPVRAGQ